MTVLYRFYCKCQTTEHNWHNTPGRKDTRAHTNQQDTNASKANQPLDWQPKRVQILHYKIMNNETHKRNLGTRQKFWARTGYIGRSTMYQILSYAYSCIINRYRNIQPVSFHIFPFYSSNMCDNCLYHDKVMSRLLTLCIAETPKLVLWPKVKNPY